MSKTKKRKCDGKAYGGRCTSYACQRWASVQRGDKHYCNGHDPEAKAARSKASDAKFRAECNAQTAKWRENEARNERRDKCEVALAGISDPAAFVSKVREMIDVAGTSEGDLRTIPPRIRKGIVALREILKPA